MVPLWGSHAIEVSSGALSLQSKVIIDAGHGGEDGGAVSCTGAYESHINLQIAKRLNDFMHMLGQHTIMIRTDDRSIYTSGTTIAARKVSDIKERVRIANSMPKGLYISIHQNKFPDAKYHGTQVFYNSNPGSQELAESLQDAMKTHLDPTNKRRSKKISGVYLMEHMKCTGVLVECGFLSNPLEERKLLTPDYQKKLAAIIAATASAYLNT